MSEGKEDSGVTQLEAIIDIADRQMLDRSIRTSKLVGKWYPFYKKENQRAAIEGLAKDFSSLADLSGVANPVFFGFGFRRWLNC